MDKNGKEKGRKELTLPNRLTRSSLSEAERRAIENGLEDIENGRTIDYEDIKAKYPEWFRISRPENESGFPPSRE